MDSPKALIAALLVAATLPGLVACSSMPGGKSSSSHETVSEYTDDAAITTRVKAALVKDPNVSATQVNVETYRGVVQLSGFVDSPASARRAAELAKEVPGVRSVKNDIRTKPQ